MYRFEQDLERRFADIFEQTPDRECVVPDCFRERAHGLLSCTECNALWIEAQRSAQKIIDFRAWVLQHRIEANDLYFQLRREDP